jgi:hypothetical protein
MGKRLPELFRQAGIRTIETGNLRMDNEQAPAPAEWELEWAVLENDLAVWAPAEEIQRLRLLDETAWQRGDRVLYVPTYWVLGSSC